MLVVLLFYFQNYKEINLIEVILKKFKNQGKRKKEKKLNILPKKIFTYYKYKPTNKQIYNLIYNLITLR